MTQPLLRTDSLCRYYRRGQHQVKALDRVDLEIARGEFVAVVGSSGSGKSTLLALLAGLDSPTSGRVLFGGHPLDEMSRKDIASYRARKVGMVFQSFNLISHRTARQNVELALYFNSTGPAERRRRAEEVLTQLGLGDRLDHRPADLSGGEQQRVAIARAIVKEPEIVFADEPTGNLDAEHSEQIAELLSGLKGRGITVVMVTHDLALARKCADRSIRLVYGRVDEEVDR